mmetsp:Transcript_22585/g.66839  ORF Transcript_22585/g.66839 Transcript_22585/m.66839 type:complete len:468 (-) Transcript_22585:239-1642(-)
MTARRSSQTNRTKRFQTSSLSLLFGPVATMGAQLTLIAALLVSEVTQRFIPKTVAFSPLSTSEAPGHISVNPSTRGGHVRRRRCLSFLPSSPAALGASVRMDIEDDGTTDAGRDVRRILRRSGSSLSPQLPRLLYGASIGGGPGGSRAENERSVGEAEVRHGMPWTESVGECTPPDFELSPRVYGCEEAPKRPLGFAADDPCDVDDPSSPLLFMPFWSWQMSYMKSELPGLRPLPTTTAGGIDVGLNHNLSRGTRIVNHCYASDEYRKIRMTYYDAGDSVQVFNSLWYPHPSRDLPVLGIDLLAFGRKKYLTVVDFQPVHAEEDERAAPYEDALGLIRDRYPSLQGRKTDRFYDSNRHFSSRTLFGRFEDERIVADEVWPAFRRSVEAHVDLVRGAAPDDSTSAIGRVLRGHAAYDAYSAKRDPAHALFTRIFGREWADEYVHGFLFDLSDGPEEEEEKSPQGQSQK